MTKEIYIVKATGEKEMFDREKLKSSLLRARAGEDSAERIVSQVESELRDGTQTREIYDKAFKLLSEEHRPLATRYSLRNAIMDLGPTGFPFEKLIAEIFRAKGFETTTDFVASGECVEHEIDIVAWNQEKLIMVEAKFHNEFGLKSDIKAALYVKARWEDLAEKEFDFGFKRRLDEGWLVTNTKFSDQAIRYAKCRNMKLVGWNYPEQGNLQDLIEEAGLHPITSLTSISKNDEKTLMNAGIVLCKQAKENHDILKQSGFSDSKIQEVMEEIDLIQSK